MDEWKLTSIANVAPTLKDLRSLPVQQQSILLLRRLATRYGNTSFGKMNFALSAYAVDLYQGYPAIEGAR